MRPAALCGCCAKAGTATATRTGTTNASRRLITRPPWLLLNDNLLPCQRSRTRCARLHRGRDKNPQAKGVIEVTGMAYREGMSDKPDTPAPDFRKGFAFAQLQDGGMVAGRVDDEEAVLVRRGDECFVIGAHCTHYHGPLADGLVTGDTVRCPWHHACFSLRTGEPLRAPALDPISCWRAERVGDTIYAREKLPEPKPADRQITASAAPKSIVILGGGAAGLAAADMLRREGYGGPITMLSADEDPPVDRPNLSKDYLAGTAKDDWMPLRSPEYYTEQKIELVQNARAASIDVEQKHVTLENGKKY